MVDTTNASPLRMPLRLDSGDELLAEVLINPHSVKGTDQPAQTKNTMLRTNVRIASRRSDSSFWVAA